MVCIFCLFLSRNRDFEVVVPVEDSSCESAAGGNSKTVNNSNDVKASQPLLFSASIPSQANMRMSLETLHCESEMMYYYAQIQSMKSVENNVSGEGMVSKSMHNLSPRFRDEQELLPIARYRSHSQGDQSLGPKLLDGMKRESALVTVTNREIVADSDRKSLMSGSNQAKQDSKNRRSDTSINQPVCLETMEQSEEKEERSVKRRSKLSSCWSSIRHSALAQILRYCTPCMCRWFLLHRGFSSVVF